MFYIQISVLDVWRNINSQVHVPAVVSHGVEDELLRFLLGLTLDLF